MRAFLTLICIISFLQCSRQEQLSFPFLTKQIFFDAPLERKTREIFDFYRNSKYLSLVSHPSGWTEYPPLSALAHPEKSEDYTFYFESHPLIDFKFRRGELTISKKIIDGKELYMTPFLKFIFNTREESEIAYESLVKDYKMISTRKRFTKNDDSKTAEFTDDKSDSLNAVMFLQGKGDVVSRGYVLIFGIGNDLDIEKHPIE